MEVPLEKLRALRERIGLSEEDLRGLAPFRPLFAAKAEEFAGYFQSYFSSMPETRMFLEYEERPGFLQSAWARWFRSLFEQEAEGELLSYLWRIGIRHVEVNLDQRFTNLGFSLVRQFCQAIISEEVPPEKRLDVARSIDRILDLCLLVETSAFITSTTRCDLEVIRGVADRIRNRVTVIGGNLIRLQKKLSMDDPELDTYQRLISESSTCEHLVRDINSYNRIFYKDPVTAPVPLEAAVRKAMAVLHGPGSVRIEMDLGGISVMADPEDTEQMFLHLLQNGLEAADRENPLLRITAAPADSSPRTARIEIFNTGTPPKAEDLERIFSPFFSTKPTGTGFGLSIARLAVRKSYGKLFLRPLPGEGTLVTVLLPMVG